MSDYVVSARKYRPDTFESLIGQETIARTLKNSIRRGQLAHAYLFCGPRGVGKTTAARIFAKTINCSNLGPDLEPCGECDSCRAFKEGNSYNVYELDAASNNGVEDIKSLMDQVRIPPQVGKYSVYIIDEVHMLSTQAFNAFLKTLEEPPAYAIFILATTEKHKILPTILSRCQTYDFNRIGIPDIVRNLKDIASKEGISIDEESLHIIAAKADGAMRDALTIFDQTVAFCGTDVHCEEVMRSLNVLDYEYGFRLVDAFLAGDYAAALKTFDEVLSKGFNAGFFISSLSSHLRDLLVCGTAGLEGLVDFPDSLRKRYAAQASRCSLKFLYDALSITEQCDAAYSGATNPRLHIEFALMRLSFINAGVPAVGMKPAEPAAAAAGAAKTAAEPQPAVKAPEPAKSEPAPAEEPAKPVAEPAVAPQPAAAGSAAEQPAQPEAVPPAEMSEPVIEPVGVPQPAAAEPKPSAAPVCRARPAKTGSSLSLSALMTEKEPEIEPVAEEGPADLPSDELINEKWKELPAMFASQPRLSNLLTQSSLTISQEGSRRLVEFTVTNDAQRKWIEEKVLRELERKFSALLGSSAIRLAPSVLPEEFKTEIKYTSQEKADDLMSRNQEVLNLVRDLSLDVK